MAEGIRLGKSSFCILTEDLLILSLRADLCTQCSHEQLPPLHGATPAFCSKGFNWLNTHLMGHKSLAVSDTALALRGKQVEEWMLLWVLKPTYQPLAGYKCHHPNLPPGEAVSCTCKAPSPRSAPAHSHRPRNAHWWSLWHSANTQGLRNVSC